MIAAAPLEDEDELDEAAIAEEDEEPAIEER